MPTTSGRSRARQGVRSRAAGPAGEHVPKIMVTLIASSIVVVFMLVMTKAGRDIDAATQHFMLFYAGVFALIGLTVSVGAGLMATDRIFLKPGHRVMAQAVHRAASFGALAFLVIHIVTEILAQRSHVIDAFIPFLSPYRTFYIGLGTIASDLILLLTVTSILRKRYTAHGKAWRWRAIHYTSYVAFVLGVLHGLLGGRDAKPYVDWSYGFAIALTALALAVRFLAISLRPTGNLNAAAGTDRAASRGPGPSPLRAAALSMTQAQLGGTLQVLPAALGSPSTASGRQGAPSWGAAPAARDGFAISGPLPAALDAPRAVRAAEAPHAAHHDAAFMPLGAPAYTNGMAAGLGAYPYTEPDPPRSAFTGPGAQAGPTRQPRYEPGYDGPPRFEGAPRKHVPQDDFSSYPYGYGPPSRPPDRDSGQVARSATGPMPRAGAGPDPLAGTGPVPRADTGPMQRLGTGPLPRADTGPMPRAGALPRPVTGPAAHPGTGPLPRAEAGPVPRVGTGPAAHPGTGPLPRAEAGPVPRVGTGPLPRADTGPMPRAGAGPWPRPVTGPAAHSGTGPLPRADTGPLPRADTGPIPRADAGRVPGLRTGRTLRPDLPPGPPDGPSPRAARRSRRADSAGPGNRDNPGRAGGDQWR